MNKVKMGLIVPLALAGTVALAPIAFASLDHLAVPVYDTRGPGLKNWQCRDQDNGWRGPWRFTRSGAYIDCESYNTRP